VAARLTAAKIEIAVNDASKIDFIGASLSIVIHCSGTKIDEPELTREVYRSAPERGKKRYNCNMKSDKGNRNKANVALIQMSCGDDPRENLGKCLARVEEAARQGAHIISTQELFRSRYFCQSEDHANFDLAEPIPGPSTEALAKLAAAHSVVIIGSLFERRAPGLYHNTAVVIDANGHLAGVYRKMHIPDDPHYYEKFYFTPGDLGFKSFNTHYARAGVCVCWDQWYPEAARLTALTGAQLLC